jgi:hypothetical protein
VRALAVIVGFVIAGSLTTGCASSPHHKLAWRTLSRGLISGLEKPRRLVIREEAEYFALWAQHAAELNRLALPPDVDFSREMVVLVAMGTRPTGGYYIDVVDIELHGHTLRILVGERMPRAGTMQVQMPTQPYQFIALPAVNARARFRTVYEATSQGSRRDARPGQEGPQPEAPR